MHKIIKDGIHLSNQYQNSEQCLRQIYSKCNSVHNIDLKTEKYRIDRSFRHRTAILILIPLTYHFDNNSTERK